MKRKTSLKRPERPSSFEKRAFPSKPKPVGEGRAEERRAWELARQAVRRARAAKTEGDRKSSLDALYFWRQRAKDIRRTNRTDLMPLLQIGGDQHGGLMQILAEDWRGVDICVTAMNGDQVDVIGLDVDEIVRLRAWCESFIGAIVRVRR